MAVIQALILDMDGVLWRSEEPIGDLPEIFETIHARGWKVILATNNATRSADQYLEKLLGFGVSLEPWQIINSSQATAKYLSTRFPDGSGVFVVGEDGLVQDLMEHGFKVATDDVVAVVAGMDRFLTYEKLRQATLLIRSGAILVGTNPDRTFPAPEGLIPGAGAILAALEAATEQNAVIVGKPEPEMFNQAFDRLGVHPEKTLVIGDRLETDIAGGQRAGAKTGLVLSGVTSMQAAANWSPGPDMIAPDLATLLRAL